MRDFDGSRAVGGIHSFNQNLEMSYFRAKEELSKLFGDFETASAAMKIIDDYIEKIRQELNLQETKRNDMNQDKKNYSGQSAVFNETIPVSESYLKLAQKNYDNQMVFIPVQQVVIDFADMEKKFTEYKQTVEAREQAEAQR